MTTLAFVLGTRPETIKLAPVIRAAERRSLRTFVVHTGQHYDTQLFGNFFTELGLRPPDFDLAVGSLSSSQQLGAMLTRLEPVLQELRPDCVLVQGDTNSVLAGALCANRLGLVLAHVEAGLRSHDRRMPEEHNRRMVDHIADVLLAPTPVQDLELRREGLPAQRIAVVGNTVVDALRQALAVAAPADAALRRYEVAAGAYAFLTLHRQENVDDPAILRGILAGIERAVAPRRLPVLFPVHPRTAAVLQRHGIALPACIKSLPPIAYQDTLRLLQHAAVVLTDSGGLQEETCILGVPCVTLRLCTERPETVDCGGNRIAGVAADAIVAATAQALATRPGSWQHPYGEAVGERIVQVVLDHLAAATAPTAGAPPTAAATMALPSDGDSSGRTLGLEECDLAARAIRSGTLNSTKGTYVARFEQQFAARMGLKHAIACANGTAAVHCAIAAIGLRGGDEVITTPITDMGALTPILYEGGMPVFADVDPHTLNVTAATIARQITARTRAVVVTHLFGLPCDMAPIVELCRRHSLLLIEDMAQAFLAEEHSGRCGTFGAIACWSLQQGKHMTTGEGGMVGTDDPQLARKLFLFVNKAWGYGDSSPDHYFPALNYRLTELQGAVALGQLQKLDWVVQRRREVAAALSAGLAAEPGLELPHDPPGGRHAWWKYAFMVDPTVVQGGAIALGKAMKNRGVFCVPRYIQKPAFECQLFADFAASPVTALPWSHSDRRTAPQPLFRRSDYPGTVQALDRVVVLPLNELYTQAHVDHVVTVIAEEARRLHQHARRLHQNARRLHQND